MELELRPLLIGTCATGAIAAYLSLGQLELPPSLAQQLTGHVRSHQARNSHPTTLDYATLGAAELRSISPTALFDVASHASQPTIDVLTVDPDRATTITEEIAGEIREWATLPANWDGEGALKPDLSSLNAAAEFVLLSDSEFDAPAPMLLASGRAGLFWNSSGMQADLEFFGLKQVTYFVDRREKGKHKGAVAFNGKSIPKVLAVLLSA